jgi:hypothetical protein
VHTRGISTIFFDVPNTLPNITSDVNFETPSVTLIAQHSYKKIPPLYISVIVVISKEIKYVQRPKIEALNIARVFIFPHYSQLNGYPCGTYPGMP